MNQVNFAGSICGNIPEKKTPPEISQEAFAEICGKY